VSLAHDAEGEARGGIWQVVDITERRHAELERSERMREQAARAEAEAVADTIQKIQRVTDAALEHLAMDDLLRELATHIGDILEVDSAAIFLREQGEEYLTVGAIVGLGAKDDGKLQIPVGETFAGRVAAGRDPVVLQDAADALQDPLLEGQGVRALLGAPLVVEGRVSGVIQVATVSERRFTREDESLLQLVADRAALAVEHARLYARELPSELLTEVWRRFLDALEPLRAAGKLGAVLLQYPRWFRPSRESADALRQARGRLGDITGAIEFRHRSWMGGRVAARSLALLRELDLAYVMVDAPPGSESSMPPTVAITSSRLAVVRLHGRRSATWEARNDPATERYRYLYDRTELAEWTSRFPDIAQRTQGVHVVCNNCHANYGTTNVDEITGMLIEADALRRQMYRESRARIAREMAG
jgi:uncharacterized protein YecE (DUF72 family)